MKKPARALIEAAERHVANCRCGGTGLYSRNPDLVEPFDCGKCSELRAAISSANAAEEGVETKWIDCEQGYPAMETKCLVLTTEPSVEIATMGMLEYWWMHKNYLRPDQVTHYLPIPAPPTEGREKEGL